MYRYAARWAAAIWIAILIVGSLMPLHAKVALHTLNVSRVPAQASWNHRAFHFIGFGVAAYLLSVLSRNARRRVLALVATIALGILLEVIQQHMGRNPFEVWDVRDDSIAAFIGAAAALAWNPARDG
jgi:VanZ family protein